MPTTGCSLPSRSELPSVMRVSQNEVYRIAQRALEGAGAGYGTDRDGAAAVAWLEARRLPGLAMLAAALDRMERAFAPLAAPRRGRDNAALDLAGRPAIAWSGAGVDCADLLLDQGAPGVRLERCRWPLFLLPAAVARAAGRRSLRLSWAAAGGAVTCLAGCDGACRIVGEGIDLAAAFLDPAPVDAVLEHPASAVRAQERGRRAQVIDADTLEAALRRTLAEGIEVDADDWARVAETAKRVQVPASAESRARGAGGGDANA